MSEALDYYTELLAQAKEALDVVEQPSFLTSIISYGIAVNNKIPIMIKLYVPERLDAKKEKKIKDYLNRLPLSNINVITEDKGCFGYKIVRISGDYVGTIQ